MSESASSDMVALCACHHPEITTIGDQEAVVEVKGHISALIGEQSSEAGEGTVPLTIVGYAATGEIDGGGTMQLDFDFVTGADDESSLTGRGEAFFPAIQTMRVRLSMQTDAVPGVLLRAKNDGVLVNDQLTAWPPDPGSTYALQEPVVFVDPDGKERVTIMSANAHISDSRFHPDEIPVGRGLRLRLTGAGPRALGELESVRFELDDAGDVAICIFDSAGTEVGRYSEGHLGVGAHRFDLPADIDAASFVIEINGEQRTARMPLSA
jgi:hypothetical protein